MDIVAAVIDAKRDAEIKGRWGGRVRARIVQLLSDYPSVPVGTKDPWMSVFRLLGTEMNLSCAETTISSKLSLRPGILFQISLPETTVQEALDAVSAGEEPVMRFSPKALHAMKEPSVRVPLSLLAELRGQEMGTEYARRAIVRVWSKDRRTGLQNKKTTKERKQDG